jgi:hypothetical protein
MAARGLRRGGEGAARRGVVHAGAAGKGQTATRQGGDRGQATHENLRLAARIGNHCRPLAPPQGGIEDEPAWRLTHRRGFRALLDRAKVYSTRPGDD